MLIAITGCAAVLSCTHSENRQTDIETDTISRPIDTVSSNPNHDFVIVDSTNFDNYQGQGEMDEAFIKKIKFQTSDPDAVDFRLRYGVPFSEHFNAIVITYKSGEHELFTTLVTLDKKDQIIDQLDVAYDEVAESAFRKIGKIEKDKITIQSWNYMNEVPIHEESIFNVLETGKFKQIK